MKLALIILTLAFVLTFGEEEERHGGGGFFGRRKLCRNAPNNQCQWPSFYKEITVPVAQRCPPASEVGFGREDNNRHHGGGFFGGRPGRRNVCSTVIFQLCITQPLFKKPNFQSLVQPKRNNIGSKYHSCLLLLQDLVAYFQRDGFEFLRSFLQWQYCPMRLHPRLKKMNKSC